MYVSNNVAVAGYFGYFGNCLYKDAMSLYSAVLRSMHSATSSWHALVRRTDRFLFNKNAEPTVCRTCIMTGMEQWRPISAAQYVHLFYARTDLERNHVHAIALENIAGQLQLLALMEKVLLSSELGERVYENTSFVPGAEEESYQSSAEYGYVRANWACSELESVLCKQGVIAIGSVMEGIIYLMLKTKGSAFHISKGQKDTSLSAMLFKAEPPAKELLSDRELTFCLFVKNLRNKTHLAGHPENDFVIFHEDQLSQAECCLFFLLKKWLDMSDGEVEDFFNLKFFRSQDAAQTISDIHKTNKEHQRAEAEFRAGK